MKHSTRIIRFVLCAALFAAAGAQADSSDTTDLMLFRATVTSVQSGLAACKAPEPDKDASGQEQIVLIEGDCFAIGLRVDRVFGGQFDKRAVMVHSILPHRLANYRIGREYLVVEKRDGDQLDLKYFEPLARGLCPEAIDTQRLEPEELVQLHDWEQRFPCRWRHW